jgi:hypothetical protein
MLKGNNDIIKHLTRELETTKESNGYSKTMNRYKSKFDTIEKKIGIFRYR